MKLHQKQSLKPHPTRLALPTLNYPSTVTLNPSAKQIKIQRSSSVNSRALLDEFQKAMTNTTQRTLDATLSTSIIGNTRETEMTKQNDSISVYIRNELKEILKNSAEKPFFEELKNNKKKQIKFKSYSKLKEELTQKISHKALEPYLKDLNNEDPASQTERNTPPLGGSSEAPAMKKPIIMSASWPSEPIKIFQNEEINKRIMENHFIKSTIFETRDLETESDSSGDLSAVGPVEQQLLERSGGPNFHLQNMQMDQQRCLTERGDPMDNMSKQNFVRYKRQMYGLYVIGNKPYNLLAKSDSLKQINNASIRVNTERTPIRASPLKDLPVLSKSRGGRIINPPRNPQQEEGSSSLSKNDSFAMNKPIVLVGVKKTHNIRTAKVSETSIQIKRTRAKSNPIIPQNN